MGYTFGKAMLMGFGVLPGMLIAMVLGVPDTLAGREGTMI